MGLAILAGACYGSHMANTKRVALEYGAGVVLPSAAEMYQLDKLADAWRAYRDTPFESRLREMLVEVLEEALYEGEISAKVMQDLEEGTWLSPSTCIRRRLAERPPED